jgi:serine/threonine-protein kinase
MVLAGAAAVAVALVFAQQMGTRRTVAGADSLTARDSGPGGDRTPATVAAAMAASPRDVPETVVVYRNNTDSSTGIQVPVVISRAESLAIAEAVRLRLSAKPKPETSEVVTPNASKVNATAAAKAAARAATIASEAQIVVSADGKSITMNRVQLAEEIGRIFADSVAIAVSRMDTAFQRAARIYRFETPAPSGRGVMPLMAPPSDGRTRIVVSNYSNASGKRELGAVGRDVARFLRASLPGEKYDVVDTDMIERAARGGGDPISMGFSLRADFVVDGIIMQRGDSVVVLTKFRDVRGRFARAQEALAPTAEPQKAFEASLALVNSWLDTVRVQRSLGRVGPGGPPRPPGVPH